MSIIKVALPLCASIVFASSASMALTYKSVKSGDWNSADTWGGDIPVISGDEKINVTYHCVTNQGESLSVYNLNVGASTVAEDARFVKVGGAFTSTYLAEIGSHTSRTAPSVFELDGGMATFGKYRLVVGRGGGNARLNVNGGLLVTTVPILMGIGTARDAAPNVIELRNSVWTNANDIMFGHSSLGTNVIHLVDSELYSEKSLGIGYGGNAGTAIGDNFLVAENSSIDVRGSVNMPRDGSQSAHVVLSNSTLKATQLLLGNVENTTNTLVFADTYLPESSTVSYMGYRPGTVNRIIIRDQYGTFGKPTSDGLFSSLHFRSVAGETRFFDVEIIGGKWDDPSPFCASQANNARTIAFRDLTLPAASITAGLYEGAPGAVTLSNCVWDVQGVLQVAGRYGAEGEFRAIDSDIVCTTMAVADDADNHDDQKMSGTLLLSGGTAVCGGDVRIRRGEGRIVLERGVKFTCGRLYLPNMTGANASLMVGGASELTVTGYLCIGNQSGASCEVSVRDGGRLVVSEDCEKPVAFGEAPNAFSFTVSGEGSLVSIPFETAFATASGTSGTLNLDGGVFETKGFGAPKDGADQTINFNGGTVMALQSGTITGANSLNHVDVGGAVFDTRKADGDVVIGSALLHKGEDDVRDGGLVKKGTGRLLLARENTFNGPVSVENGVLVMACRDGAAIPSGVAVSLDVANGAYLDRLDESCRYPDGMVISIVDDGRLIPGRRYVLATNWDASSDVTVNLPDGWISRTSGTDLTARRVCGSVVGIR